MKSYIELIKINEAFLEYIRKCNNSKLMKVRYYQSAKTKTDCSFIGTTTVKDGKYGIHFFKQRASYAFGTLGVNGDTYIEGLTFPQEAKIPGYIKDALKEVAETKRTKIINAPRKPRKGFNEWE